MRTPLIMVYPSYGFRYDIYSVRITYPAGWGGARWVWFLLKLRISKGWSVCQMKLGSFQVNQWTCPVKLIICKAKPVTCQVKLGTNQVKLRTHQVKFGTCKVDLTTYQVNFWTYKVNPGTWHFKPGLCQVKLRTCQVNLRIWKVPVGTLWVEVWPC